ncbi:VOC family protein [Bdellovibrio sp. GT3]|uniref:VOC family protein n=1 Tax=Bdellovibrio sp. GT3 TaxID=3136282 RepID=UPI0030F2659D
MENFNQRSENLNRWYEEKLHLHRDQSGGFMEEHFQVNEYLPETTIFRIQNLATLVGSLAESGVRILDFVDENERGKFAWICDPDGHKIALWQPWDESQSIINIPEPE